MSETREYVLYCRWDDVRNGLRRVAFSDRPSRSHFDAVVVRLVAETEKLCQCGHEEREHTKDGTCFGGGASCQCNDFRLRVTLLPSVARAPDATQEIEALRADAERWRFAAKYGVDMEYADSVYVYRGPAAHVCHESIDEAMGEGARRGREGDEMSERLIYHDGSEGSPDALARARQAMRRAPFSYLEATTGVQRVGEFFVIGSPIAPRDELHFVAIRGRCIAKIVNVAFSAATTEGGANG